MSTIKFKIGGVIIERELDEITKAQEEGQSIELAHDELVTYSTGDFEKFKTNLADAEYKKGKVAGVEMAIKEGKEKFGLEFEGKTLDNFADAFKVKIESESKVEPSKKIKDLETDLGKVRENLKAKTDEFEQFKGQVKEKETRQSKDSFLLKQMPEKGLKVSSDIALMALKAKTGLDVSIDEAGKFALTQNGEVLKNQSTLDPIDPQPFIIEQLKQNGLLEENRGGNGGGDSGNGGHANNYDKFVERMKGQNITEGSVEFSEKMNAAIKDGTLKMD